MTKCRIIKGGNCALMWTSNEYPHSTFSEVPSRMNLFANAHNIDAEISDASKKSTNTTYSMK